VRLLLLRGRSTTSIKVGRKRGRGHPVGVVLGGEGAGTGVGLGRVGGTAKGSGRSLHVRRGGETFTVGVLRGGKRRGKTGQARRFGRKGENRVGTHVLLLRKFWIPPIQLEVHVAGEVAEPKKRECREFLTGLVALRVEVGADGEERFCTPCSWT
jgi:hypothetical protein